MYIGVAVGVGLLVMWYCTRCGTGPEEVEPVTRYVDHWVWGIRWTPRTRE